MIAKVIFLNYSYQNVTSCPFFKIFSFCIYLSLSIQICLTFVSQAFHPTAWDFSNPNFGIENLKVEILKVRTDGFLNFSEFYYVWN